MTLSRRTFVRRVGLWVGLPGAAVAAAGWLMHRKLNPLTPLHYAFPADALPPLPATPECAELEPTESVTEGPFYTPNTPQRRNLRSHDTAGRPLRLSGRVFSQDCRPISAAVVDVWSCDGNDVYDNTSFRLRGHQFTDAAGSFTFDTVKPKDYKAFGVHRTPHIHVKVQGRDTRLLTTQLFFPEEPLNEADFFFRRDLLVSVTTGSSGELHASFDFVLLRA